ncbi:hypothetical protein HK100_001520 [Physocladia obscura]|uniref:Uncharacterized protein n=1 Tax=Physocladia obscura TaxID=109957 RepID=A0AAD5TA81_9FUNG|nr:hypothetical protein HK100_001520 [Physocladia obscura]
MQSFLKKIPTRGGLPLKLPLPIQLIPSDEKGKDGGRFGGVPLALHALWYLADAPESLELLRAVCIELRKRIDSNPAMRAAYLLARSCKHLVLHYTATNLPYALTPSVFFALSARGAVLPKLLIEQLLRANLETVTSAVPQDSIDHIVALGFKLYGDALRVSDDPSHDDAWMFHALLSSASPDLMVLRSVVAAHHFVPALVPKTHPFWASYWTNVRRLVELDTEIAAHILQHSGVSYAEAKEILLYQAICNPAESVVSLQTLNAQGYSISDSVIRKILLYPNPPQSQAVDNEQSQEANGTSIPSSITLLQEYLSKKVLLDHVLQTLSVLLKSVPSEASPSPQQIDFLLRVFKADLPDNVMATAILAAPPSETSKKNRTLPFMTAFGQNHGGVVDSIWQVVCAEYGPQHPFVAAFVVDVVIGGAIIGGNNSGDSISNKINHRSNSIRSNIDSGKDIVDGKSVGTDAATEDTIVVVARNGVIRRQSIALVNKRREQRDSEIAMAAAVPPPSVLSGLGRSRTVDSRLASFRGSLSASGNGADPALLENDDDDIGGSNDVTNDAERDSIGRATIQALLEGVGVPMDPGMLIPICRAILILKSVKSRFIDFMARVEKDVIKSAYSAPELDIPHNLSKSQWISALYRTVLESQAWIDQVLTISELTVLEGLKPAPAPSPDQQPLVYSRPFTGGSGSAKKRSTGVHPPVPGIFSAHMFAEILESAGDATVVAMDAGPIPSSVQAVARSVRMRRQKSVSSGMVPPRRVSSAGGGDYTNPVDAADIKKFYRACEELVWVLETAQRGGVVAGGMAGEDGGEYIGPFERWITERDSQEKSWNGWLRRSSNWFG